MTQPTLDEAIEARDQAIQQVEDHADGKWMDLAVACVLGIAATRRPFTSDHIWDVLDGFDIEPHEPRALGAVMKQLSRRGVIRPTGNYVQSSRPKCHARPVKEWIAA